MDESIVILIKWGPLVLFGLIILVAVLFGIIDGRRKSYIFLIHSIISFTICVILYYVLVNNEETDYFLLTLINFFLGSSNGLQNLLHVSSTNTTLSACLIEYLPNSINLDESIKMLLLDNAQYLLTLVDLIYHIAFFIAIYVLYLILKFILWLTYILFYSNRKFKKATQYEVYANNTDTVFNMRRTEGAIIGFFKGLVSGICCLSIIGSVFFIATGGPDADKIGNIKVSDKNVNSLVGYYGYIEEYGNSGIIGALNNFKDNDGTPYYLMLTDLVLQGKIVDDENGVNNNMYLRKELSEYVSLAKKTINLVNRYSDTPIDDIVTGKVNINTLITPLLLDPGFAAEFKSMIYSFDNELYAVQFAYGILDSIVNNVDNVSFTKNLDPNIRELIKVMFKKGYYSSVIPEEKAEYEKNNGKLEVLPYFKTRNFLTKSDFCEIYDLIADIMRSETKDVISIVESTIPHITNLSLFKEDSVSVSPVLGRVYNFAACSFLKNNERDEVSSFNIYKHKISEVNWVNEIHYLASCSNDLLGLYKNIHEEDENIVKSIFKVFDEKDPKYEVNNIYYNNICETLSSSRLLGEVLKSKLVNDLLDTGLKNITESFEMPDNIEYANTFDDEGNLITKGEISNLLVGLKSIATNKRFNSCIQDLMNNNSVDMIDFLSKNIKEFTQKDANGKNLFDYFIDSDILESVISGILIDASNDENSVLYIPKSALIMGKETNKNIIIKDEIRTLFNNLPTLLKMIDISKEDSGLDSIIFNKKYDEILNNKIIQGTIGKVISNQFKDNANLILPRELETPDAWVSTSSQQGELKSLINFIRAANFKISDLSSGDSNIIDKFFDLAHEDTKLDLMLNSKIIHYTISNKLESDIDLGDFELIIPNTVKTRLVNDTLVSLIDKNEIKRIIKIVDDIGLMKIDTSNSKEVIKNIIKNKDKIATSDIIKTTMINYLVNSEIIDYLDMPEFLNNQNDGSKKSLTEYSSKNLWKNEFDALLIALDELFDISNPYSDFRFDEDYLDTRFKEIVEHDLNKTSSYNQNKKVIDVCFDSYMISYSITKKIDEFIDDELLENTEIRNSCKVNGIYKVSEVKALLDAFNALNITIDETSDYNFMEQIKTLTYFTFNGKTKLDIIYDSVILSRIITEEIEDIINASSYLVNHSKAYQKNIEIYRKEEVKAIIDILGDQDFNEDFNIRTISINKLKEGAFTSRDGEISTNSYLLVASISKNISKINDIIIPYSSYESSNSDGTIVLKEKDVYDLFNALTAIGIDQINDLNINDLTLYKNTASTICSSSILRATIAKKIKIKSNGVEVSLIAKNSMDVAYKTKSINDLDIVMISEDEMRKVINSLFIIIGQDSYSISTPVALTIEKVLYLYTDKAKFDELLQSNIINVVVSNIVLNAKNANAQVSNMFQDPKTEYDVIYFSGLYITKVKVYTYMEINNILKFLVLFGGNK